MMKKIAGVAVSVFGTVSMAHAALPAEVTTAMTEMKVDGLAVAGAFLLAAIVIAALLVAKRGAK